MDMTQILDSMQTAQVAAVKAGYQTRDKEVEELVRALRELLDSTSDYETIRHVSVGEKVWNAAERASNAEIEARALLSRYPGQR